MPDFANHKTCLVLIICASSFIFGMLWGVLWLIH